MPNRLRASTSPYLQQHADNPVDWWEWGQDAFAEAARRDVPVLLSIGYAACHWCHVMAHESFEDPEVAALMNARFVCVKVDREERPDVDAVYMTATQAMTGQGGWPMTCFLTPAAEPFHCGTYYPPAPRPGFPSFTQLLVAVHEAWSSRDAEVRQAGALVVEQLRAETAPLDPSPVDGTALDGAAASLLGEYDRTHGGFGGAPKFPPTMVLEFLLRHHERTGSREALSLVEHTATAMADGGLNDQLAGGFARYSTDAGWAVPHFEKMLYDNALLLRLYGHLARRTGSARYREVAADTARFLLDDLRVGNAFASSLDADAAGVEGSTYVWTPAQLVEALGPDDGVWAASVLGVTAVGNVEGGASTLRRVGEFDGRWEPVRGRLLAARAQRPQPARDDKVVTAWNGLAVAALAEAGAALGEPSWVDAASLCAAHVLDRHLVDGRLRRVSRDGRVGAPAGVLEDYACLADGLLSLHQATAEVGWLDAACALLDTAVVLFAGGEPGSYHDTALDADPLIWRPGDPGDNATPSGASALAGALLTASVLAGPEKSAGYQEAAASAIARNGLLAARAPRFAGHWLSVAEAAATGPVQVAVAGGGELAAVARAVVPGGGVVVAGEPGSAPLLVDRPLIGGSPAAYVCRGYVCDRPTADGEELRSALTRGL
ncbi:thioredoxin domain-containing protein [Actinokineospora bangkokensis]|uniref:N-acylglucosamine 2-epimerase n=1 Tax=Actinokineospora bangkokensis TaxID=1193682 RepID=A0A1Q9LDD1_9PSEU|nr:thioredoxin domain-containing protein [Actinokineospora bangkokensis]OLR90041.1 N-acylglucosamine 2-epimerase [Actinokineospora bangkokensis]